MVSLRHWVVVVPAVLFALVDQHLKKGAYQEVDKAEPTQQFRTVVGGAAPNHGDFVHHFDRNSAKWTTIWATSLVAAWRRGAHFLLVPPLSLVADDILFATFGWSLYDTDLAIQRAGEFFDILLDHTSGHGLELGFNLWNGTLNKTVNQAQLDKWEHVIRELGLQQGDRLLDVGCGYGDWLAFLKSKGIQGVGINIYPAQADFARSNWGLEVVNTNWKDFLTNATLQNQYSGRFDVVTFMDSPEHFISGVEYIRHAGGIFGGESKEELCEAGHQTYYDMFKFASNMLDHGSPRKRVFASMLHGTDQTLKRDFTSNIPFYLNMLLLSRFYSGHYPMGNRCHCFLSECKPDPDEKPGPLTGLAKYAKDHFRLNKIEDVTEDYRLTAVKSPRHFQAPEINLTPQKVWRLFLKSFVDPFFIYMVLATRWDTWMRLYGENYTAATYDREFRSRVSFQICYWFTFELLQ